ncbi:MAG: hypothetical protein EBU83_04605 [bacterium]|nr:hypothetical protein [Candidatus Aquidulcis sp.]
MKILSGGCGPLHAKGDLRAAGEDHGFAADRGDDHHAVDPVHRGHRGGHPGAGADDAVAGEEGGGDDGGGVGAWVHRGAVSMAPVYHFAGGLCTAHFAADFLAFLTTLSDG